MKVTLEKDYRRFYTLEDLDRAKAVIACEKEDDETITGWAEYAAREGLKGINDYVEEVLKASAHTAKNCRAWNKYGIDSQDMDVWIEGIAKTGRGFIEFGAYLSDIWETGATEYKHRMYIQYYKRA